MSVVASVDGFSGLCCGADKRAAQFFRIAGRDPQNGIEDPGLVLSLPVSKFTEYSSGFAPTSARLPLGMFIASEPIGPQG